MNDDTDANRQTGAKVRILVWDLPVRLFHWTLLGLMIALYVSAELLDDAITLHATLGLTVLALVIFRLIWGVAGSTYARFGQFVRGPGAVLRYSRSLFDRRPDLEAGHNPLGGWMVLVLLALTLVQAGLGLFSNDDVLFEGPLAGMVSKSTSDLVTGLHRELFDVLLVLVGLHVAAVVWHKLFKGENLVIPMFTGYKELPAEARASAMRGGSLRLAVALLAVCLGLVFWLLA